MNEPSVAFYFPHVDYGQSILLRLQSNRWIIVDANQARGGRPNGTLELLRGPAAEGDFEIIALVITHFHKDHSGGVAEVLEFCRDVARRRACRLGSIIETLVLPLAYHDFYQFVQEQIEEEENKTPVVKATHLRTLLTGLEALRQEGVRITTLQACQFAWKSQPESGAALQLAESWIFTFYPPSDEVLRIVLEERAIDGALPSFAEIDHVLQQGANRHSYVLGVGHGRSFGDLQVLLTSDIPGKNFGRLTDNLLGEEVPAAMSGEAGAYFLLTELLRRDPASGDPEQRLRPFQCLTVPHHGSGTDPARAADLDWWLDERRGRPDRPAFAVVQGGPYVLRDNTLAELFAAQLEVFATTEPLRIQKHPPGHTGCKPLDDRLLPPMELVPQPPSGVIHEPPLLPAHLLVEGGRGGVHRVVATNVYQIVPNPPRTRYCAADQVYP